MNRKFIQLHSNVNRHWLFAWLLLLKAMVIIFSDCNMSGQPLPLASYPLQYALRVNPDELDIASIASNYNAGYSFAANKGYYARHDKQITAWRTSTPVFIHIIAQRMYRSFHPEREIVLSYEDPYFYAYAFIVQCLSLGLFWVSLYAFYEMADLFLSSKKRALLSTILYALMPSVIYYVGSLPGYENIALPILIVVTAFFYRCLQRIPQIKGLHGVLIAILAGVATLIRPHTTLLFYAYGAVLLLVAVVHHYRFHRTFFPKPVIAYVLLFGVFLLIIQIPIVYKNHRLFGKILISNQAGFNFLLSHNEHARGSWLGDSGVGSEWDKWVVTQIPEIEQMNEYEEAKARKQLAIDWIKANPGKEVVLALRKIAIFFLPDNYLHPKEINLAAVFTAIVHLLFGVGLLNYLVALVKSKFGLLYLCEALPFVAVLTALLFSVLFFVDHRWRYYADPFMLLIAVKTGIFLLSRDWRSKLAAAR